MGESKWTVQGKLPLAHTAELGPHGGVLNETHRTKPQRKDSLHDSLLPNSKGENQHHKQGSQNSKSSLQTSRTCALGGRVTLHPQTLTPTGLRSRWFTAAHRRYDGSATPSAVNSGSQGPQGMVHTEHRVSLESSQDGQSSCVAVPLFFCPLKSVTQVNPTPYSPYLD